MSDQARKKRWQIPSGPDLVFLLAGKTGNGKSATGNSILGQEERFRTSPDARSATLKCDMARRTFNGRTLKVFDIPGYSDTELSNEESAVQVMTAFQQAVAQCPDGINAVLVVLRFGSRMTDEERKSVQALKGMLGRDVLRDHGVCVFTHGDNFHKQTRGKEAFESWYRRQDGPMASVIEECRDRCVLFDNFPDGDTEERQRYELVSLVDQLDGRYTGGVFEKVAAEWRRSEAKRKEMKRLSAAYMDLGEINMAISEEGRKRADGFRPEFLQTIRRKTGVLRENAGALSGSKRDTLLDALEKIETQLRKIESAKSQDQNYNPKSDADGIGVIIAEILSALAAVLAGVLTKNFRAVATFIWEGIKSFFFN